MVLPFTDSQRIDRPSPAEQLVDRVADDAVDPVGAHLDLPLLNGRLRRVNASAEAVLTPLQQADGAAEGGRLEEVQRRADAGDAAAEDDYVKEVVIVVVVWHCEESGEGAGGGGGGGPS